MLHQIKARQFPTDLCLYQQWQVLQKIVAFKDFPRLLSDFPVLFKADLIFTLVNVYMDLVVFTRIAGTS